MAKVLGVDASALFAGDEWHKDDGTRWIVTASAEWNGAERPDGGRDVTWLAAEACGEHKGRVQRFVADERCPLFVVPEYARERI